MSALSDYLEAQLASHVFGSGTFTKPTVLAIALCSTPPVDSDTGALVGKELPNANGYARQTLNPSASNWTDPVGASGIVRNLQTLTFTATDDWGWVSGVAVCDSATHGAGNMLVYASLSTPKNIGIDDQLVLSVNKLSFQFQ